MKPGLISADLVTNDFLEKSIFLTQSAAKPAAAYPIPVFEAGVGGLKESVRHVI